MKLTDEDVAGGDLDMLDRQTSFVADEDVTEGFCYGRIEYINRHRKEQNYYKVRLLTGKYQRLSLKFNL